MFVILILIMVTYNIIEHKPNPIKSDDNYIISALAFELPSYIKFFSKVNFKNGQTVDLKDKEVYKENEKIGSILIYKSGIDIEINRDYDIKYAGGYSTDGKIIYISRNIPCEIKVNSIRVSLLESIGRHHELTEKWLIDNDYEYPYAHEVATEVEKQYIESLGVNWNDYNKEVNKLLHSNYSKKLKRSPSDLDISPYIYSHDNNAIKEIRDSIVDN